MSRSTPDVVVQTARQILRRLMPDDAEMMHALNADPEVMRYLPDAPFASIDEARAFLERYQEVYRTDGFARWAVVEAATGECIGWCGLRRLADGSIDVGYRYRRASWGRGFATEAARACVDYGFAELSLPRIVGRAYADNAASIRVLEKIGLRFEARENLNGVDEVVLAVSRDEWGARRAPDGAR